VAGGWRRVKARGMYAGGECRRVASAEMFGAGETKVSGSVPPRSAQPVDRGVRAGIRM